MPFVAEISLTIREKFHIKPGNEMQGIDDIPEQIDSLYPAI